MKIKNLKKITPKEYLKKAIAQKRHIDTSIQNLNKINKEYAEAYSHYKVGDSIVLTPGVKEGYDQFKVEAVEPIIEQKIMTQDGKTEGVEYNIDFKYTGQFIGFQKEAVKGIIKLTQTTPDEQQDKN